MVGLDIYLNQYFASVRGGASLVFFEVVSFLGEWYSVAVFCFFMTLILLYWKEYRDLCILWAILFFGIVSSSIIKVLVDRPRPELAYIVETSKSFPSNHVVGVVIFWGFVFYLLNKYFSEKAMWLPGVTSWLFVFFVILMSLSRLYLGVHYLSDVIGGVFIGMIWLNVGIYLSRLVERA
ncbi:MAG: phosphatase PAP2 family protein [Candidatus Paceibacterota bacterium]|jgi:undecaprenyl-diphosphatase